MDVPRALVRCNDSFGGADGAHGVQAMLATGGFPRSPVNETA